MRPPKGLQTAGGSLRKSIQDGLPEDWELDEREAAILELACGQADDLTRLQAAIATAGAFVHGSQGQDVLNPAIVEARQARLAIGRLLGQLQLPDGAELPAARSQASLRAQRAANIRWARREKMQQLRAEARGGRDGAA